MTDTIDLPVDPASPPLIVCPTYTVGSTIFFDASSTTELRLPLQIRDENTTETLAVRYRIDSLALPLERPQPDFECPEKMFIPGSGTLVRSDWTLAIPQAKFPRNSCSRLTIVASSSFANCSNFEQTTTRDDDGHRGRAVFWVWEVSDDPLSDDERAMQLANSCPHVTHPSSSEK